MPAEKKRDKSKGFLLFHSYAAYSVKNPDTYCKLNIIINV